MLLLLNKKNYVRVFIGDEYILACLLKGKNHPKLIAYTKIDILSKEIENTLIELKQWLENYTKSCQIEWILGTMYTQFLLIPWSIQNKNNEFLNKISEKLYIKEYRKTIEDIVIKFDKPRFNELVLVIYYHKKIIQLIDDFSKNSKMKNKIIEPYFSVVWNRFYDLLKTTENNLYIKEGDRFLCISQKYGIIKSLTFFPDTIRLSNNTNLFLLDYENSLKGRGCSNDIYLKFESYFFEKYNIDSLFLYPLCGVI